MPCPHNSVGLEASSLRVRLALLLLLPPEHTSRLQALRERTRSPSGLSHANTVRAEPYQEWLDLDSASSSFRHARARSGGARGAVVFWPRQTRLSGGAP